LFLYFYFFYMNSAVFADMINQCCEIHLYGIQPISDLAQMPLETLHPGGQTLPIVSDWFGRLRRPASVQYRVDMVRMPAQCDRERFQGPSASPSLHDVMLKLPNGRPRNMRAFGKLTCCDAATRRVDLSGFVYTSLVNSHSSQWLHLIARHTAGYRPQPYQQLAAVLKGTGHESTARDVFIAQQRDLHDRGELGGRLAKGAHRLWGVLAGYGYRSGRTVLALLMVLLVAAGLGIAAGHTSLGAGRYVTAHTSQTDNPNSPCSLLEQIGVGIDRSLPLATTGTRDRCDFDTSSPLGEAFTAATWILQTLVWALAILAITGYLRLIRTT